MSARVDAGFTRADFVAIVLSNGFVLALALWQRWPIAYLVWPYWFQSVLIGVFQIWRMLALKNFSTEGFESNGRQVSETRAGLVSTAVFFAFHYGFFHFIYLGFLLEVTPARGEWRWILIGALAFAVSQALGQPRRLAQDAAGRPNLGSMMFLPYLRIVPMHLTILLGLTRQTDAILLFGTLKTIADVLFAWAEARIAASAGLRNAAVER